MVLSIFPKSNPEPDFVQNMAAILPHQWNLNEINVFSFGDYNSGINVELPWKVESVSKVASKENIFVAILDTGVCSTHLDLTTILHDVGYNAMNDTVDIYVAEDDSGHGSHVAGIVGGSRDHFMGVAPNVKLISCKCVDHVGRTNILHQIRAIDYAISANAQIINCSFGGLESHSRLYKALDKAKNRRIIVVAAAGNGDTQSKGVNNDDIPYYPASYAVGFTGIDGKFNEGLDNILSIAATTKHNELASFSNYGKASVHLAAAGEFILSTILNNDYGWNSGTSMAAPYVTGTIALIKSRYPCLSYRSVIEFLKIGVDETEELMGKTSFGGKLNADKTLAGIHQHFNQLSYRRWFVSDWW
eukprot:gene15976-21682_t